MGEKNTAREEERSEKEQVGGGGRGGEEVEYKNVIHLWPNNFKIPSTQKNIYTVGPRSIHVLYRTYLLCKIYPSLTYGKIAEF